MLAASRLVLEELCAAFSGGMADSPIALRYQRVYRLEVGVVSVSSKWCGRAHINLALVQESAWRDGVSFFDGMLASNCTVWAVVRKALGVRVNLVQLMGDASHLLVYAKDYVLKRRLIHIESRGSGKTPGPWSWLVKVVGWSGAQEVLLSFGLTIILVTCGYWLLFACHFVLVYEVHVLLVPRLWSGFFFLKWKLIA